jgi:hypothetical protein
LHLEMLMKTKFIVKTRWEYYVANVAGIVAILGLLFWCTSQAITERGINFMSIFFWIAILLLIMVPFTLISFFSSMKAVEVTTKGLIISYVFQKHVNEISFSEITKMESSTPRQETTTRPRTLRDTFKLILVDGRAFDFTQSQFNGYGELKAACRKNVGTK